MIKMTVKKAGLPGNYNLTCCHVHPLKVSARHNFPSCLSCLLPTASCFPLVSSIFCVYLSHVLTLTKSFTHSLFPLPSPNKPLAQKGKEEGGERGGVEGGGEVLILQRLVCQSYRLFCKLLTITYLTSFLHALLVLASRLNVKFSWPAIMAFYQHGNKVLSTGSRRGRHGAFLPSTYFNNLQSCVKPHIPF